LNMRPILNSKIGTQLCIGAEAGTRTLTGILPLRPERSASANSATPAGGAEYTQGSRGGTTSTRPRLAADLRNRVRAIRV